LNLNVLAGELKPERICPMRALKIQTVLEHNLNIQKLRTEKQVGLLNLIFENMICFTWR